MDDPLKKDSVEKPRKSKDKEQPRPPGSLLHVPSVRYQSLPLTEKYRWLIDLCGQVVQGGTYLCDGAPASGKSTLARQAGLDLALNGYPCLYILTEEPPSRLKNALVRMTDGWTLAEKNRAFSNIFAEGDVADVRFLPTFLARKVLGVGAPYRNVRLIVIDSINGTGLRHSDAERWQAVYEFANLCRSSGITLFMISHVNKRNEIAGPRALEHNIDAAIRLRKSGAIRHIGISKNRFGPETHRLLPLEMNAKTVELQPSKHAMTTASIARSFLPGIGLIEVQASVSLPSFGSHARVLAPNLPRKEVELLLSCLSQINDLQFDDLTSTIRCRLPGDGRYSSMLGLALCTALAGSLLQRPISDHQIMLGEIDLNRSVRNLPDLLLAELGQSLLDGSLPPPKRLIVPLSAAVQLPKIKGVDLVACRSLDEAIAVTFDGGGRQ